LPVMLRLRVQVSRTLRFITVLYRGCSLPFFHLALLFIKMNAPLFFFSQIAAGNADEEGVITIRDRMNVTFRKGRCLTGIEAELLLQGQLRMPCGITTVQPFPARHVGVMLVLAIHHPARAMVVGRGLAALFPAMHQYMHVRFS